MYYKDALPFSPSSALAHLLQIESLGDCRLHLYWLLVHKIQVNLSFSTVVVDRLLFLDEPAQIFYVRLQEDLCWGKSTQAIFKKKPPLQKGW